jgi:hypothetical protein
VRTFSNAKSPDGPGEAYIESKAPNVSVRFAVSFVPRT